MNDEMIADLKQFITNTVSQQLVPVIERLDRLEHKVDDMHQEMRDGFAGVGETLDIIHKQIDQDKAETDTRLTKLEQKTA